MTPRYIGGDWLWPVVGAAMVIVTILLLLR